MKKVVINFSKLNDDDFDRLVNKVMVCGGKMVTDEGNCDGIEMEFNEEEEILFVDFVAECLELGCTTKVIE